MAVQRIESDEINCKKVVDISNIDQPHRLISCSPQVKRRIKSSDIHRIQLYIDYHPLPSDRTRLRRLILVEIEGRDGFSLKQRRLFSDVLPEVPFDVKRRLIRYTV